MKDYIKPEIEVVDFTTEVIATDGTTGGGTTGTSDNDGNL